MQKIDKIVIKGNEETEIIENVKVYIFLKEKYHYLATHEFSASRIEKTRDKDKDI